jgi:hypothetical protein
VASDDLAFWAFVISCFSLLSSFGVFLVEFFRYRREDARLSIRGEPHILFIPKNAEFPDGAVMLTAVNRGGRPTTITGMLFRLKPSFRERLTRSGEVKHMVVTSGLAGPGGPVPFVLQPGCQWQGFARREAELAAMIESDRLEVGVSATHQKVPEYVRLRRPKKTDEK